MCVAPRRGQAGGGGGGGGGGGVCFSKPVSKIEQFINLNLVDSGHEALYHPNRLQNTRVLPRFVSSFLTVII